MTARTLVVDLAVQMARYGVGGTAVLMDKMLAARWERNWAVPMAKIKRGARIDKYRQQIRQNRSKKGGNCA